MAFSLIDIVNTGIYLQPSNMLYFEELNSLTYPIKAMLEV